MQLSVVALAHFNGRVGEWVIGKMGDLVNELRDYALQSPISITNSPNIQSPNHPITQSPNHPITQSDAVPGVPLSQMKPGACFYFNRVATYFVS